jgi:hypothetical protein
MQSATRAIGQSQVRKQVTYDGPKFIVVASQQGKKITQTIDTILLLLQQQATYVFQVVSFLTI